MICPCLSAETLPSPEKECIYNTSSDDLAIENADITSIIRLFSKRVCRTYLVDETVKGKLSIYIPKKVSLKESIQILDSALKMKGYKSIREGENLWKVVSAEDMGIKTFDIPERKVSSAIKKISIKVNTDELNTEFENFPRLLTQARAVPYFGGGKFIGLRLFAIRRESLYEKLKLKNNDILQSINGKSLKDLSHAMDLFQQLKSEKTILLRLERNRQNIEFEYHSQ